MDAERLEIDIDLSTVQREAERVRSMLRDLVRRFDLRPFEYSREVRIAPTEIPHSHPRITLNTWVKSEIGLLSTYLHEQMHWYVTWYSHASTPRWQAMLASLRDRYPSTPPPAQCGARDEFSTHLHLVVNWLEIEVASRFIERSNVIGHVLTLPFYQWIYQLLLKIGSRSERSIGSPACYRSGM